MKVMDFNYELPEELIAQKPIYPRDHSRLMVINKKDDNIEHKHFYDIINYLNPGDVLVLNNTKVIPARLFGEKKDTGAKIEVVLLKRINLTDWEALVKPGKRIKDNTQILFGNGKLIATSMGKTEIGGRILRFSYEGVFEDILSELGQMPLPHYIKEKLEDKDRYQTVYAETDGSAAAPTAGLHFTNELLEKIKNKGIKICYVLLHVGLGTFRPVKVDKLEDHKMHSEYYELSEETAKILQEAKDNNNRIIAAGTTSIRTLETVMNKHEKIIEDKGWTDIFIYPGYKFKIVNGIITNFHLPKSTLIMLVSAFLSRDMTMKIYELAVEDKYRFFSFGDAMFIK